MLVESRRSVLGGDKGDTLAVVSNLNQSKLSLLFIGPSGEILDVSVMTVSLSVSGSAILVIIVERGRSANRTDFELHCVMLVDRL